MVLVMRIIILVVMTRCRLRVGYRSSWVPSRRLFVTRRILRILLILSLRFVIPFSRIKRVPVLVGIILCLPRALSLATLIWFVIVMFARWSRMVLGLLVRLRRVSRVSTNIMTRVFRRTTCLVFPLVILIRLCRVL